MIEEELQAIPKMKFSEHYKKMWPYVKPYWFRALLAVLISIPIGALDSVVALALKPYMDIVLIDKSQASPVYIPLLIVAFTSLQGFLNYFATYLNAWVGTKIDQDLKRSLYKKLLYLEPSYFDTHSSGFVLQRFGNDSSVACTGLLDNLKLFVSRFFSSVGLICVLIYNSWQLSIIAIVVLFLALLPLASVRRRIKNLVYKSVAENSKIFTNYNEAYSGNKTIAAYNMQDKEYKRFDESMRKVFKISIKMIQKIMANSRYFTDNSVTTVWDVSMGNCAAGIVVDFYGRHQRETNRLRGASDRLRFILPKGGTCISPDPIGMFRGAPNPQVAEAFLEYIVSDEGQCRIGFKVGTRGGPQCYALHRTPIRKDFYTQERKAYATSPEMNPFEEDDDFPYQPQWTAPAFSAIRMLSKVLFMDTFTELAKAWYAIIKAQKKGHHAQAKQAMSVFEDLDEISYDWVVTTLIPILKSKNPLQQIDLETELTRKFRNKYLEALRLAKGK